jgi:cyclopropane fatty-acyl-phospholipid synthase-like methyltransferase
VDQLAVGETDRILEIGGGRGVAAAVICARLTRGSYLGIDRSETAVRASAVRNWEHVERGTARFEQQALQDVDPTQLPRFDKVFAINVNLFWTRPAQGELALVRQLLSDDGQLDLFYDSPTPAGTSRIAGLLAEHLEEAGYAFTSVTATLGESTVIGLSCQPH